MIYITVSLIKMTQFIEIDNIIKEPSYQNDTNFFSFETPYKIIAIYYPPYYQWRITNYYKDQFHEKIKENYDFNFNKSLIEKQVKLAKNHGIFGFGIVQNLAYNIKVNEELYNLFLYDNDIRFPFFIILDYDKNHNLH